MHGWAISQRIQQISQEVLQVNQGSLYPALHRLEHQGWIEAEWGVSELGRRARFYRLTARAVSNWNWKPRIGLASPRLSAVCWRCPDMPWRDYLLRARALFLRRRVEDELDEELQFHLAMQARKNLAAGMSDGEASRQAHVQFGGVQQAKEECRDARGVSWIETLAQDIRYAVRGFRRSPGFALTVVGTIALGLGLNTTVFTIFNAYVLRPLAVRDPHSLYQFTWTNRGGEGHLFSWAEFQDVRKQAPAFSEMLGYRPLKIRADGHVLFGHLVTGNYFRMVGVNASLGRTLVPEDAAAPGGAP